MTAEEQQEIDRICSQADDRIKELEAQLSSKEQECAKLKIDASNHAYQCDRAKQERDKAEAENSSLRAEMERIKSENTHHIAVNSLLSGEEPELTLANEVYRLRAENERLKEELDENKKDIDFYMERMSKAATAIQLQEEMIEDKRKRCEDLEAACRKIINPDDDFDSGIDEIKKLLSQ